MISLGDVEKKVVRHFVTWSAVAAAALFVIYYSTVSGYDHVAKAGMGIFWSVTMFGAISSAKSETTRSIRAAKTAMVIAGVSFASWVGGVTVVGPSVLEGISGSGLAQSDPGLFILIGATAIYPLGTALLMSAVTVVKVVRELRAGSPETFDVEEVESR